MSQDFYQFEAKTIQGDLVSMDKYKGKIILVVNTASKCGFTPQFEGVEDLYKKYQDQGLVILGFPCNQFAKQEPGDDASIVGGCMLKYGVSFPMFSKVEVNGENTHPIYKFLKQELKGLFGGAIKWNFTKFLIDQNGKPIKRFAPKTKPEKIAKYIEEII